MDALPIVALLAPLGIVCSVLAGTVLSRSSRSYVEHELPATVVPRRLWLLAPGPQAALSAALAAAVLAWGAATGSWFEPAVAMPVTTVLLSACSVDAVCHRLPNRLLGAATALAVAGLVGRALLDGPQHAGPAGGAVTAVLCALATTAVLGAMSAVPSGLGMGDVKLGAVLALWLGPHGGWVVAWALAAGFLIGGVAALVLMALGRAGRKELIAFGPYLLAGGLVAWAGALA